GPAADGEDGGPVELRQAGIAHGRSVGTVGGDFNEPATLTATAGREIPRRAIAISDGLLADQDGVAVEAEGLEQRRVELVQVREDDALAGELDALHHLEERRGEGEVD